MNIQMKRNKKKNQTIDHNTSQIVQSATTELSLLTRSQARA
jgi:hypothetical protein